VANNDDGDPDYQILSQEDRAESVLQGKEVDEDDDEEIDDGVEEESASSCPKLSVIRNPMDTMSSRI
jgi:hypothetical protein